MSFDGKRSENPLFQSLREYAHLLGGLRGAELPPEVFVVGDAAKGDRYLTGGLGFIRAMIKDVFQISD